MAKRPLFGVGPPDKAKFRFTCLGLAASAKLVSSVYFNYHGQDAQNLPYRLALAASARDKATDGVSSM